MYLLSDAPLFLEFFKRIITLCNDKPGFVNKKFQDEFFIAGRCNCNQKDCATVYLKRKKEWKDHEREYSFHTENVSISIYGKNYLEIECIGYKDFPHKQEINKLFGKKKYISSSFPRLSKKVNKLTKIDRDKLDRYFKYRKRVSIYEKIIKNDIDFRVFQNQKLFTHIR